MAKSLIPLRPSVGTTLSDNEQNCLVWHVITGCRPVDAFRIFVKPELSVSPTTLEKVSAQFFASRPAMIFIESYKETMDKFLKPKEESENNSKSAAQRKIDKEKAVQSLMDYVVEEALNFKTVEDKESILKFADKLGLLGDAEEKVEAPRRYLPETCDNCQYKKWIETNCELTE